MHPEAPVLVRPQTLLAGKSYVWVRPYSQENTRLPVTFVGYCPCPALVIVADHQGLKMRLSRDEIYAE